MRIAYLDCSTGISGDMTLGALFDAGIDVDTVRRGIDSLRLPQVRLHVEPVVKCGFRGTSVRVEHAEQHAHRHLSDIVTLIDAADALTPAQKGMAQRIFRAVATAEAKVHGASIEQVHFHEVGAVDSIVDIVGAAIGFDLLGAEHVVCSPVPTGRGSVQIAHGVCTVPTPGTAELLKGVPLVDIPVDGELTTPTGAAIVTTFADRFSALPGMTIESIGYGAGTMDLPDRANLLRLFVGTADASAAADRVYVLETNLDDVSPELIGYTKQKLFDAGALDVYSVPVQMKKDRPAVLLSVLCRPADVGNLETILFDETATFGVRRHLVERSTRCRREVTVETPWGAVRGKLGWRFGGRSVFSPEFDDCARVAAERSVTLREVYRAAESSGEQMARASVEPQRSHSGPLATGGHDHGGHDHGGHDHGGHDHGGHDHGGHDHGGHDHG